ncbi:YggT family protein [Oxalobacter paraformigenes]|uniref:YggT family protein n=1 Tax=Oxalobacter paraformigenes TaxID=556268 RepID=C3X631_9BURK|nr:YggT family protein [Oxalobacter paraformigenes]EEO28667.1 hypothetical protein OFAG_01820 [Oxalobacter paraformigenes]
MLYSVLKMIVDAATTILGGVFLLRFWTQIVRARPPLQIAHLLFLLTDWLIKPLRKVIPGWAGYDWSTLLAAILMAVISALFDTWLINYFSAKIVLFLTMLSLLNWVIYGLMGLLIIEAIFSWVNPYSPIAAFVKDMNRPLLHPIRRILPTFGGFDFSTLIAFFLLQILSRIITNLILSNLI